MSSPKKKRIKLLNTNDVSNNKRGSESAEESCKRRKTGDPDEDIQAKKRINFITACELVSYKAYNDHYLRFQLTHLLPCAEQVICKHSDHKNVTKHIKFMPSYAQESFKIEMKANMWHEALEVCRLCITPDQHLPANILKDIMEIMLNAHDNEQADYTIDNLIDKCHQLFELNLCYHPPCMNQNLRTCYHEFLTSPMDLNNKFTKKAEFGCEKGILKYCLNRLEHEISLHSKDGPVVDKYEHTPEYMRQSVAGLQWQKDNFEIYELLDRTERIKRLFAVLEVIVELLQCDLAILHTRYTNNVGKHLMRSSKPLMAFLLMPENGHTINDNCKQIIRLFLYMIHLKYPEVHIKIMITYLNTMIQTLYVYENNSNSDYPNTGKNCTAFANEFYKMIAEMPHKTVIKVLERIKPDYMQFLIGSLHIKRLLRTQEENPIKIFTEFLNNSQWKKFPQISSEIKISKKTTCNVTKIMNYLERRFGQLNTKTCDVEMKNDVYYRFDPLSIIKESKTSLNHVIHAMYITLEAYLDAYSVQNIQETLDELNNKVQNGIFANDQEQRLPDFCSYFVTENLIIHYQSLYQSMKDLILQLQTLKKSGCLPTIFRVFEGIELLGM